MGLKEKEREELKKLLFQIAVEYKNYGMSLAPVRTGNLRADIKIFTDRIEALEVSVGHTPAVDYAIFVHQGTGLYGKRRKKITPKKAKALKTPFGYKKSVKGQKANPYLFNALKELERDRKLEMLLENFTDKFSEDIYQNIKKSLTQFHLIN